MNIEELRFVCQEAVRDLLANESRPLPPAVVLPGPTATRIVKLPEFPPEDVDRLRLLDRFAQDEILATDTPAYGFVSEAELDDGTDVVITVYGAHGHDAVISAVPIAEDGTLGEFSDAEPLAEEALPFLHPLQHAVQEVSRPQEPDDVPGIPGFGE